MKSLELEHELNNLREQQQTIEADMAISNQTLAQTQRSLGEIGARRNELAAKIAPLERLIKEIASSRAAIETQRKAAKQEIAASEESYSKLIAEINEKLPAARRDAIRSAIAAIDSAIDGVRRTVTALQHRIAETETSVVEAQKRAASFDGSLREALAQLRHLSEQIQAASRQVAMLNASAKNAAASGRTSEALYLAGELEQALDGLSQLTAAEKETALVNQLEEAWRESTTAREDVAAKTAALEQLRRDLVAAERDLQSKIQGRDAGIKAALLAGDTAPATMSQPVEQRAKPGSRHSRSKTDR